VLTALDLFCGCGGFSLGADWAGVKTVVAVDNDPILSSSFERNFADSKLVRSDVGSLGQSRLDELLPAGVDIVMGGAPCQGFSEIGRRDPRDPRRELVAHFFRIVGLVDPAFFVFENVRGLLFRKNISELTAGVATLPAHWVTLEPVVLNAADFGAPTHRRRLFVFGFNTQRVVVPELTSLVAPGTERVTVKQAINDLRGASAEGTSSDGFCRWRYGRTPKVSRYAGRMRSETGVFTGHTVTRHTPSTAARFANLEPGEVDRVGRYPRLTWHGTCPTLRAGTGSDKGRYQAVRPIHPTEDRVITVRESARLQGFPDDFRFHPTVWHSCRMIGNSVAPVMAEQLFRRLLDLTRLSPVSSSLAAE
jgi:DNA (cytosine-5)-methyltransferase 1